MIPIIGIINWILDANYMYLCVKPIAKNPLLIGDWPWYILGIECVAVIHFSVIYLPFAYLHHLAKVNKPTEAVSV